MKKFLVGSSVTIALISTSISAAPFQAPDKALRLGAANDAQIWLVEGKSGKDDKGGKKKVLKKDKKDREKAAKGKPEKADKAKVKVKVKVKSKGDEHASKVKVKGAKVRRSFTTQEREEVVGRIVSTVAPEGRDMLRVLGASGLLLATPQVVVTDIPQDQLITYRNCPPGLAKKDPPCVPPGLAKKGVTYEEWASYDQGEYDAIWLERRDEWLNSDFDVDPDPQYLLLQSDQIATLFDLDPAPEGQRYALIDGLPVLLDQADYESLLLVNEIAQVAELTDGLRIAPTAALTQDELISLYRLPTLGEDENYAVVNGQLLKLKDTEYELLQMIRVARAIL